MVNDIPPRDRDIAMVFQNYALYPHMSVFDNMAFGLMLRKFDKAEIKPPRARTPRASSTSASCSTASPRRSRAGSGSAWPWAAPSSATPRCSCSTSRLSNLDAKLRVQMRTEIKKVHQTVRTTTVYVTHDQVEAMTLADRVVVMNGGIIEQVGPPQELYHHPATRFVAGFIGSPAMNFIPARLENGAGALRLNLPDGITLPVPAERTSRYAGYAGKELLFGIRPEHLTEADESRPPERRRLRGDARGDRADGRGDVGASSRWTAGRSPPGSTRPSPPSRGGGCRSPPTSTRCT